MVKPSAFLKEVQVELLKVVWPTRKEVIRLTLIVLAVSVFIGFYIGGVDFLLTKIMELVLGK